MGRNRYGEVGIKWWMSWIVILIMFFVFWPVAIVLLIKRISTDKSTALNGGRLIKVIGWFSITIAALGFLATLGEADSMDIGMVFFFLIAGIVLVRLGRSTIKSARRTKQYIGLIVNQRITSIDELARVTGTSYNETCKELQKIVDKGYFKGAYINLAAKRIILPGQYVPGPPQGGAPVQGGRTTPPTQMHKQVKEKIVTCKSCGANNVIVVGAVRRCEFCGSHIQG